MNTGTVNLNTIDVHSESITGAITYQLLRGTKLYVIFSDDAGSLFISANVDGVGITGYVDQAGVAIDSATPNPVPADALNDGYWIYSQRSGTLFEVRGGVPYRFAIGYSGNGASENNPDNQCIKEHGPLPRGKYTIGPPFDFRGKSGNILPFTLRLIPDLANDMCDPERSGFLIHIGNLPYGPDNRSNASDGCICLPDDARKSLWSRGGRTLQVVSDDPSNALV